MLQMSRKTFFDENWTYPITVAYVKTGYVSTDVSMLRVMIHNLGHLCWIFVEITTHLHKNR